VLEGVSRAKVASVFDARLVPPSERGQPRSRPALSLIDLGTALVGLIVLSLALFAYHFFDFNVFWEAGHRLLSGDRLYPSRAALDVNTRNYFVYPPIVAVAFVPLSLLPPAVAASIYLVASILALYATLRILGVTELRCYVVMLLWMPMLQAVGLGTIAPFLALALALAWKHRERTLVLSLVLAFAVVAKLFLWPLFFWLVATRRWKATLTSAAACAALVLIPWAALGFRDILWYPHVLRLLLDQEEAIGFSVTAVLSLLHFTPATIAVQLISVASVFWFARRYDGDRRAFIAAVLCALVLTPLVWVHYFAVLVVPIALAQRRFGWLWLLPVLAFTPYPNNLHHWWIAAPVSAVLMLAGALTLRSRWPEPLAIAR
jgi:hypothetical protein